MLWPLPGCNAGHVLASFTCSCRSRSGASLAAGRVDSRPRAAPALLTWAPTDTQDCPPLPALQRHSRRCGPLPQALPVQARRPGGGWGVAVLHAPASGT